MIKFSYKFSSYLISDIKNNFVKKHMCAKAAEVLRLCAIESPEWFSILQKYLHYDNLIRIVFAKAKDLPLIKHQFSENLSIIDERYNPQLFFKKMMIDDYYLSLNLNSKNNKNKIMLYKNIMIVELTRLEKIEKSYFAGYFRDRLLLANTPVLVKKELKAIKSLKNGFTKELRFHFSSVFPKWVELIPDIFKYNLLSVKFGYDIVISSGLSICPFCNEEKIKVIKGNHRNFRPALDHFYAKSKYPYLGVSLYNLMPIGERCNSAFKSDADMFDGFMNPLISGMNENQVFDFTYNIISNSVDFEIIEDDDFLLNKMLFELDGVYNTNEYKRKYLDFRYLYIYFKGLRTPTPFYENSELMNSAFNISKSKGYNTWPAKKFELDALEDIFKN